MRHAACLVVLLLLVASSVGCGAAEPVPPTIIATAQPAADTSAPNLIQPPAWRADTTVGTVVAQRPRTARIFELVGVDYCCDGAQSLAAAAEAQALDLGRLLEALHAVAAPGSDGAQRDWTQSPLPDVVNHIIEHHHAYLRRELPRLAEIVSTVARVHGAEHPELAEVECTFTAMRAAIVPHLDHEETEVFPAIRDLATARPQELRTMLAALEDDHGELGESLHRLRELTRGYAKPKGACALYAQMLEGLAALERDTHTHVHLENEVLLPRVRERLRGS